MDYSVPRFIILHTSILLFIFPAFRGSIKNKLFFSQNLFTFVDFRDIL